MPQTTCSVSDCDRPVSCRGWCRAHHVRALRGTPLDAKPIRGARRTDPCAAEGCDRVRTKREWCNAHYQRVLAGQPVDGRLARQFDTKSGCVVAGCDRQYHANGYCEMHDDRVRRTGTTDKAPPRIGADTPAWVGDDVTYNGMHHRLRNTVGSARAHGCVDCGLNATDWAYDHKDPNEVVDADTGYPYSVKTDHYQPMCRSCHIRFDRSEIRHARRERTTA